MENSNKKRVKKSKEREIEKRFNISSKGNNAKTFDYLEFISKNECTSLYYGEEQVEQKCYICLICDPSKNRKMCEYCYINCHEKCREGKSNLDTLKKIETEKFACKCGLVLKHIPEKIEKSTQAICSMRELDNDLGIKPYYCTEHQINICCICQVVCHKNCKVEPKNDVENIPCNCISNFHTNFNELALSFPLEQYKEVSGADIWPVQILNILFSTKSTFKEMIDFFDLVLSEDSDFNHCQNKAIIDKFLDLLELFSDTFNRKFKTYYYCDKMLDAFSLEKLFPFIKKLEIRDENTTIIKFRLLFILLFMHLRKDFQILKSLTSTDFLCSNVLQRLTYKQIIQSKNIFTDSLKEYEKININEIKNYTLQELCNLITKGMNMNHVSVEDNQDEFEIGLKLICFMLKRMMFDKKDLILFIDSLFDFHTKFFDYITSEKNNIYSLIDIFNAIVEICFMICVNYNDLVIEDYLNGKTKNLDNFIHSKSSYSSKLFTMVLKNCDLFKKHYDLLVKPDLDKKDSKQKDLEKKKIKHKKIMQIIILSKTTGVKAKMPENEGIFSDKIINTFIETLMLFSLADNSYQKQLEAIKPRELSNYYEYCEKLRDEKFFDIMKNVKQQNILLNLKNDIERIYFKLFTTSYNEQKGLKEDIRSIILNACKEIKTNIENLSKKPEEGDGKGKGKGEREVVANDEKIIRKILKNIENDIEFAKNSLLLDKNIRELIVDNFIVSQIDEQLFKGLFFLTNINFQNIINDESLKLIFHFLSIFLLSEKGVCYIITGKNIQNIIRFINRFRFDEDNKNIKENKNRTEDFNVNCIKVVIHFLCVLSELIKIYQIKTLRNHKTLAKFKKVILTHLNCFGKIIDKKEEKKLEFKNQLKECIEIFNNLSEFFTYDEYEEIKIGFMDLFEKVKLLNTEDFCKLLDKTSINLDNKVLEKRRKMDLAFYFQFLELITKNTFFIYNHDDCGKKLIDTILKFIDIKDFSNIITNSSDILSFPQKVILLRLMRAYYLLDYIDPINYLKKNHLLTSNEYIHMIHSNLIKDEKIIKYLSIEKDKSLGKDEARKYEEKLKVIDELIILIELITSEINKFPLQENNDDIRNYIMELIFTSHEISNTIYLNRGITNKIIPYFYKLVKAFISKKKILNKMLKERENVEKIANDEEEKKLNNLEEKNSNVPMGAEEGKDDEEGIKKQNDEKEKNSNDPVGTEEGEDINNIYFNIFNKDKLYTYIIEAIFEIYKSTKINSNLSLKRFLEIYDVFNEANFPPFSLIEVKDYEYFYEGEENEEEGEEENDPNENKLSEIKNSYIEEFKSISTTSFLGVLTGDSTDKKIDYGEKYVNLFRSFINSIDSTNSKRYRALLCIMDKMLFYDGEHIQGLFAEMIYDKNFFKNFNRELNYYIVQSIDSSQKYNICSRCAEITDMTKLTIQFLQLLGEGFNTDYHRNILLKGEIKESNKKKQKKENEENVEEEEEEDEKEIMNKIQLSPEQIEKIIQEEEKKELKKKKSAEQKKEISLVYPKNTIYESIISNLRRIYHIMELSNTSESELPFDKLCVLSSNLIDFIIEYIDTEKELNYIINNNINSLFFGKSIKKIKDKSNYSFMNKKGILPVFTMRIINEANSKKNYSLRKIMLAYMKIKYFQLLKAYLQIGHKTDFVSKLLSNHLGPIQLFIEILFYMKELLNNLISKDYEKYNYLLKVDNVNSYIQNLQDLYMYEEDFRSSVELSLIFKICIIIKIFEDVYKIKMLKAHFENDKEEYNSNLSENDSSKEEGNIDFNNNENNDNNRKDDIKENKNEEEQKIVEDRNESPYIRVSKIYNKIKKEKEKNGKKEYQTKVLNEKNIGLNSKFAIAVYKFLDKLVLKVEIRGQKKEGEKKNSKNDFIKTITNVITKKIINLKDQDKKLANLSTGTNVGVNLDKSKEKEEEKEENSNDEEENENKDEKETTFFIKPYISFHLSSQSQTYFNNNVDRATATTKYSSLISFADYCIFEMMYNMKYIGSSKFKQYLSNISFYFLQVINYLLILLENVLLIYHYYRKHSLTHDKYDVVEKSILFKKFTDVVIVLVVKLAILIITCIIWFYFKFIITLQRNIMQYHEKNFIFRHLGQAEQNISHPIIVKLFQNNGSIIEAMSIINKDIGFFGSLKSIVLDTILFNIEIDIFIFSLLLNILFLIFGHPIFLSIECLFIATIFPSLLNVFKAFTAKFSSLCACLLFTYLIIYVYNWITIFYMRSAFDLGEVVQYESGKKLQESFCHSSLQCFMVLVSYGTRAGGGIGDELPVISFKSNTNMFIARFFYDVTFFIFVIMIMGNATFGLIVDTFGALRDETYNYENDKDNICFICQLSRDGCLLKNINFDNHVEVDHNIWNYIHFLTYLHLFNPNDFTRIEGSVWDRLIEKDYGWLPIESEDAGEDNGGD